MKTCTRLHRYCFQVMLQEVVSNLEVLYVKYEPAKGRIFVNEQENATKKLHN